MGPVSQVTPAYASQGDLITRASTDSVTQDLVEPGATTTSTGITQVTGFGGRQEKGRCEHGQELRWMDVGVGYRSGRRWRCQDGQVWALGRDQES